MNSLGRNWITVWAGTGDEALETRRQHDVEGRRPWCDRRSARNAFVRTP
jgi:hypothetical protein